MIFSILYYVILIIFSKLNAFRKIRENLKPNQKIGLYVLTGFLFLFDCFNIYTNPNFLSKNITYDEKSRKYMLIIFISIFWSVTFFLFSDYHRKQFKKIKPSRGTKGPRGLRGLAGSNANDKCDRRSCREEIIFKKLLNHINEIYSEINQKPSNIKNNYIKNKLKLLIQSEQFKEYEERTSFDETLNEVKDKWSDCIRFIMAHPHGDSFLENPSMDDNDFDYLLEENQESPFDKIKHFDMWYWGEPLSSQIKVQYRCDIPVNDPKIKILESNQYDLMWRSAISKQTKSIEKNKAVYNPYKNKGNSTISIYRPKILTTEKGVFYPTGDAIISGDIDSHKKSNYGEVEPQSEMDPNKPLPQLSDPVQKVKLISGNFVHPDGFKLKYSARSPPGSIGEGTDAYSFWEPYLEGDKKRTHECVGTMVSTNLFHQPPSTENFACPPKKCLLNVKEKTLWSTGKNDNDINVSEDFINTNYSIKEKQFDYNHTCLNKDSLNSAGDWKYLPKFNDEKYSITAKLKNNL